MSKDPRSNWDAPADGDFASYVERLNAAQTPSSAASPLGFGQQKTTTAGPASAPVLPSAAPAQETLAAGLAGKLRAVRVVFLLVLMGQVVLLLFFQKGSLPLLFFTGMIWFFLGRAQSTLSLALPSADGGDGNARGQDSPNLQRLREQLQRSIRERATKQKK